MFKFTLIFILSVVATQAAYVEKKSPVALTIKEQQELQNIWDEIEKLLQKLEDAVDKVVAEVEELYEKLEQKVEDLANEAIEAAKEAIDREVQVLLDKMEEIINDAGATNVAECVDTYEPEIKNIPSALIDNLESCVTDKIDEAKAIINNALDEIKKIYQEIVNIKQEVKDCGTGISSLVCLTKLAAEITEDIITLPADILDTYYEALKLIDTILPSLTACGAEQIALVPVQGLVILNELKECVGL